SVLDGRGGLEGYSPSKPPPYSDRICGALHVELRREGDYASMVSIDADRLCAGGGGHRPGYVPGVPTAAAPGCQTRDRHRLHADYALAAWLPDLDRLPDRSFALL